MCYYWISNVSQSYSESERKLLIIQCIIIFSNYDLKLSSSNEISSCNPISWLNSPFAYLMSYSQRGHEPSSPFETMETVKIQRTVWSNVLRMKWENPLVFPVNSLPWPMVWECGSHYVTHFSGVGESTDNSCSSCQLFLMIRPVRGRTSY